MEEAAEEKDMVDWVKEEEEEEDMVDCIMEPETLLQEEGEELGAEIRLRPTTTLLSPRPFPTLSPTTLPSTSTSLPSTEDWPGPHQLHIEVTTDPSPPCLGGGGGEQQEARVRLQHRPQQALHRHGQAGWRCPQPALARWA